MAELNDKLITYGNLSTFYNNLKSHDLADKQDALTAGQNIDITNDVISAKGYKYDDNTGSITTDNCIVSPTTLRGIALGKDVMVNYDKYGKDASGAIAVGYGWEANFTNFRGETYTFSWETDATTITCNQNLDTYVPLRTYDKIRHGYVLCYNQVYARVLEISGNTITLDKSFGEGQTNVKLKYYEGLASYQCAATFNGANMSLDSCSSSFGQGSIAGFSNSFAMGYQTTADGYASLSTGQVTLAEEENSSTFGTLTVASNKNELACGSRNKSHSGYKYDRSNYGSWGARADNTLFSIGNGLPTWGASTWWRDIIKSDNGRKNALEIMENGDAYIKGIGGYDGVHIKTETGYESTKTLQDVISGIDTSISGKQDALTAGSNITISNNVISATDTTYSDATTSASGLMSAADKTKLNGIEANAEVNVIEGVILSDSVSALTPDANKNITIPLVSTSSDGLMSAEDKAKLDGLEAYTVATTAEIEALFAPPTPAGPAFNEIWYTTTDNEILPIGSDSGSGSGGSGSGSGSGSGTEWPRVLSNVYEDGKGVVTFAEDITELPSGAFNIHQWTVTSVTLPASVVSFGSIAFLNCQLLTTLTCYSTTPPTTDYSALDTDVNTIFYVPAESVNDYKTAAGWSTYASRIQAISE